MLTFLGCKLFLLWHISINRDQPLSGIGFASIQILSHAGYHNTPLDNRAQKRSSFKLSAEVIL